MVSSTRVTVGVYAFDTHKFSNYWENLVEKEKAVIGLGVSYIDSNDLMQIRINFI